MPVFMDDRNDALLVRRVLAGDHRGFSDLVHRYTSPIFNLAFRLLNDRDSAADVVQSTFMKVYENLRRYDSRYRFFSWLYRIALNESLTVLQQRRGRDPLPEDIESEDNQPDAIILEHERNSFIQSALMKLSDNERVVIVLRHFSEMSYAEIAAALGINTKTVKSRLFSARLRLRMLLARVNR